jgi:hypothetical protein
VDIIRKQIDHLKRVKNGSSLFVEAIPFCYKALTLIQSNITQSINRSFIAIYVRTTFPVLPFLMLLLTDGITLTGNGELYGADSIMTLTGKDELCGPDTIMTLTGKDELYGQDTIMALTGKDELYGPDSIMTLTGKDELY